MGVWLEICGSSPAASTCPICLTEPQWHLDEMYVKVNGELVYLWRTVDHEGAIPESYVTKKRDGTVKLTRTWFVA